MLLDHNVLEQNIILLTLFATPHGIKAINKAFPSIRISTSEVHQVAPTHFCQKYFGTDWWSSSYPTHFNLLFIKSMHFESMNDTLEPPIIAAESNREWFLILLMYVHTVLEWRMSIVKQQSENFNWFYKLCFKFFQDCYCVIKKNEKSWTQIWLTLCKISVRSLILSNNREFSHPLREIHTRNSLYDWNTRRLDNQHWIATLV